MLVGITEKMRWTPFYQEMACDPRPPGAVRVSKTSLPPGMAEMFGLTPSSPPFGAYFNETTVISCQNDNQASFTMKALGSKMEVFSPNLTDLALGGAGLPYQKIADGHLASDAHFAAGSRAQMRLVTEQKMPLAITLELLPVLGMQGYVPMYVKSVQPIETCSTLFGYKLCQETTEEQWCGTFGGNCMVEVLGADGVPVVPELWEPAQCSMTESLCGREADMKAELTPAALGVEVVATVPCPPATGLPSTLNCSIVSSPGVNYTTGRRAKVLHPASRLTARAREERDRKLEEGEAMIGTATNCAIAFGSIFGALFVLLCLVCSWRAFRSVKCEVEELPTVFTASNGAATSVVKVRP